MAGSSLHAKRYAQAVFEIAIEKKEIEQWRSDLERVATLARDSEFVSVMENPKFALQDKVKLLNKQIQGVGPMTLNLVYILTEQGNFSLVTEVYNRYLGLLDAYYGREKAEVTTAVPLDENEKLKISERLQKITGKKVFLIGKVDPDIIGGIIIRVGGKILDGSTSSRLTALKGELTNTTQ